jgi:FHA domain
MMRRTCFWLVLLAAFASSAEAQISLPFFKKKKKQPPPAEAAAKAPAEAAAPGAAPPPAPGAQPVQSGAAPAISAQSTAPAVPGQPLTAEQAEGLRLMIDSAIAMDARSVGDTSSAVIQGRMRAWQTIMFALPPGDPRQLLAKDSYDRANKAADEARAKAMAAGTADSVTRAWIAAKILQGRQELSGKQYDAAERSFREVLARDPTNKEAESLLPEALRGKRVGDIWRKVAMYSVVLVPLLALVALAVRAGMKKREENVKKAEDAAAKRSAVLQVVDGVARGKLVTIDKEKTVFKIGAATGAQESEKNDLVISDSAAQVSRYHCTLVRKDGEYFVVDSSINGTVINGEPLKRGDHYPLEDGDEITIAQVSRLKFLHT